MKLQHKIICSVLGFSTLFSTSCDKGFEDMNKPYKDSSTETATPAGFLNNLAMRATDEDYTLYIGIFMPETQLGIQNASIPYPNYITTFWRNYYRDLIDYNQIKKLIARQSDPSAYTDIQHMATILISHKTLSMLDRYGDIPYSEAGRADDGVQFYKPKYDSQESVYNSVLDDLKTAVTEIGAPGQSDLGGYETLLGGDIAAWKKFGNALRLRYAVRLAKTGLQSKANGIITEILGNPGQYPLPDNQDLSNLHKSNFGNYSTVFKPTSLYVDRYWYAFRELSVSNIRMSTAVFNLMSSTNATNGSGFFDPRYKVWFMPNNAGQWIPQAPTEVDGGTPYPNTNTNAPMAPGTDPQNTRASFNFYLTRDYETFPYVIISEADVHFLKAEIYNQGYGVTADQVKAEAEYKAGMKASAEFWYKYANDLTSSIWPASAKPGALSASALNAFLDHPKVKFTSGDNSGNYKKIIAQAWLSNMFNSVEAWNLMRRTNLTPAVSATYARLPYPDNERLSNEENWRTASGAADLDTQRGKKVYWMP